MITISRRLAKAAAGIIRRTFKLAGRASRDQIVQVFTDREGLHIVAAGENHAIEYRATFSDLQTERVLIPLKALTTLAADNDELAIVSEDDRGVSSVRWQIGALPQSKTFDPVNASKVKTLPVDAIEWTIQPEEFLFALREAFRTTDDASSRFSMSCVQIRGEYGDVSATDGRVLFLHNGFSFPFRDTLLVRSTDVFERDDLFGHGPVRVGIAGDHMVVRTGPWSVYLGLNREGRFPQIDSVVPHIYGDTPTMELGPDDRKFLVANLRRLPDGESPNQPITIELNGKVAIRVREPNAPAMELVLVGSRRSGGETRVAIDRRHLARAARMGFSTIHVTGSDSPVVCRDQCRTFVWAALYMSEILRPSPDAVIVESAASHA